MNTIRTILKRGFRRCKFSIVEDNRTVTFAAATDEEPPLRPVNGSRTGNRNRLTIDRAVHRDRSIALSPKKLNRSTILRGSESRCEGFILNPINLSDISAFLNAVLAVSILEDNISILRSGVFNVLFNRICFISTACNLEKTRLCTLTTIDRGDDLVCRLNNVASSRNRDRHSAGLSYTINRGRLTGSTDRTHDRASLIVRRTGRRNGVIRNSAVDDDNIRPGRAAAVTDNTARRTLARNRRARHRATVNGERHKDRTISTVVTAGDTDQAACPVTALDCGVLKVAIIERNSRASLRIADERANANITSAVIFVMNNRRISNREVIDHETRLARPRTGEKHIVKTLDRLVVAVNGHKRITGSRNRDRIPICPRKVDVGENFNRDIARTGGCSGDSLLKRRIILITNLGDKHNRCIINRDINTHVIDVIKIDYIKEAAAIFDRAIREGRVNIILAEVNRHILVKCDIGQLSVLIEAKLIVVTLCKFRIADGYIINSRSKTGPTLNLTIVNNDISTITTIEMNTIGGSNNGTILKGYSTISVALVETRPTGTNQFTAFNENVLSIDICCRIIIIDIESLHCCAISCNLQLPPNGGKLISRIGRLANYCNILIYYKILRVIASEDINSVTVLSRRESSIDRGIVVVTDLSDSCIVRRSAVYKNLRTVTEEVKSILACDSLTIIRAAVKRKLIIVSLRAINLKITRERAIIECRCLIGAAECITIALGEQAVFKGYALVDIREACPSVELSVLDGNRIVLAAVIGVERVNDILELAVVNYYIAVCARHEYAAHRSGDREIPDLTAPHGNGAIPCRICAIDRKRLVITVENITSLNDDTSLAVTTALGGGSRNVVSKNNVSVIFCKSGNQLFVSRNRSRNTFCSEAFLRIDVLCVDVVLDTRVKRIALSFDAENVFSRVRAKVNFTCGSVVIEGDAFGGGSIDVSIQGVVRNRNRLDILAAFIIGDCTSRTRESGVLNDNLSCRQISCACTFTEDDAVLRAADNRKTVNREALLGGYHALSTSRFADINGKVINRCIFLKAENRVPVAVIDSIGELEGVTITVDRHRLLELRVRTARCIIATIPLVVNRDIREDFNRATFRRRLEGVNKVRVIARTNLSYSLGNSPNTVVFGNHVAFGNFNATIGSNNSGIGREGATCDYDVGIRLNTQVVLVINNRLKRIEGTTIDPNVTGSVAKDQATGCSSKAIFTEVTIGEGATIDNQSTTGVHNSTNPGTVSSALVVALSSSGGLSGVSTGVNSHLTAVRHSKGHGQVRSSMQTLLVYGAVIQDNLTANCVEATSSIGSINSHIAGIDNTVRPSLDCQIASLACLNSQILQVHNCLHISGDARSHQSAPCGGACHDLTILDSNGNIRSGSRISNIETEHRVTGICGKRLSVKIKREIHVTGMVQRILNICRSCNVYISQKSDRLTILNCLNSRLKGCVLLLANLSHISDQNDLAVHNLGYEHITVDNSDSTIARVGDSAGDVVECTSGHAGSVNINLCTRCSDFYIAVNSGARLQGQNSVIIANEYAVVAIQYCAIVQGNITIDVQHLAIGASGMNGGVNLESCLKGEITVDSINISVNRVRAALEHEVASGQLITRQRCRQMPISRTNPKSASDRKRTIEFQITKHTDAAVNGLTIACQLNTGRKSKSSFNSCISKKNDFVTSLSSSNRVSERVIRSIANLSNCRSVNSCRNRSRISLGVSSSYIGEMDTTIAGLASNRNRRSIFDGERLSSLYTDTSLNDTLQINLGVTLNRVVSTEKNATIEVSNINL